VQVAQIKRSLKAQHQQQMIDMDEHMMMDSHGMGGFGMGMGGMMGRRGPPKGRGG
jgi:hypothetical protein